MLILFPKDKQGVKIATKIIFEEIASGAGVSYILGMIGFARKFGAITPEEESALIGYLEERGKS